jgi:hypothetical protein
MMFPEHCIQWSYLYYCWKSLTCKDTVNWEVGIHAGQCLQLHNRKALVWESEDQCAIAGQENKSFYLSLSPECFYFSNLLADCRGFVCGDTFTSHWKSIWPARGVPRCGHVSWEVLYGWYTVLQRCTSFRVSSPFQLSHSVYELKSSRAYEMYV